MKVTVKGLEGARRELRKAIQDVHMESAEMVSVILHGIASRTRPYVPVDTSVLINSEERKVWDTASGPKGYITYGEGGGVSRSGTPVRLYYRYVHDGPQKNWKKPGASNRYLLKGIREFVRDDLSRIIAMYSS
jgi:hypothetical protein